MLHLKLIALLIIAGSSVVAASSVTYYYAYALPKRDQEVLAIEIAKQHITPTPSPKPIPSPVASSSATSIPTTAQPISPLWIFNNTQYDVSTNDLVYLQPGSTPTPISCSDGDNICKLEQKIAMEKAQVPQFTTIKFNVTIKNISVKPFISGFAIYDCKMNIPNLAFRSHSDYMNFQIYVGQATTISYSGGFYDSTGNEVNAPSNLKVSSCKISPNTINGATIESKIIQF